MMTTVGIMLHGASRRNIRRFVVAWKAYRLNEVDTVVAPTESIARNWYVKEYAGDVGDNAIDLIEEPVEEVSLSTVVQSCDDPNDMMSLREIIDQHTNQHGMDAEPFIAMSSEC